MAQISRILILISTFVALVAGQNCTVPVPFSTKIIGRTFSKSDDCYRPSTETNIKVFSRIFVYRPISVTRFLSFSCEEKYVFHFRRDGKDPFVTHFPSLGFPDGIDLNGSDKLEEFCKREQPKIRKKFFPVGKTRKMFINAVRTIVKGGLEIRDFGCMEDENGLIMQVPGRAFTNVDLDGVITYLLGVAYQYNFCAET